MEAGTAGPAQGVARPPERRLLLAATLGAAVALALGVYGNVHDPSEDLIFTLLFSSTTAMKVYLATVAVTFALIQVLTATWIYGRLGIEPPEWAGYMHRISGRLAFIISLPVAYHCLWSLGFQDTDGRVLAHSLLGCFFYGAFAAKVVIVRSERLPGLALPLVGGLVFTILIAAWLTSAVWFVSENGLPAL